MSLFSSKLEILTVQTSAFRVHVPGRVIFGPVMIDVAGILRLKSKYEVVSTKSQGSAMPLYVRLTL